MIDQGKLRKLINEALDHGLENGYEELAFQRSDTVLTDLAMLNSEIEKFELLEEDTHHDGRMVFALFVIKEWQDKKRVDLQPKFDKAERERTHVIRTVGDLKRTLAALPDGLPIGIGHDGYEYQEHLVVLNGPAHERAKMWLRFELFSTCGLLTETE